MARFEGFPPPTTKKIHVCTPGESKGVDVAVNRHNYRSFDALLEDLSRRIPKLNYGARRLFTADGNDEISKLDQLEHEKTFVNQLVPLVYA